MPRVICNSTPLIHLSKSGRLYLLKEFFAEVLIPKEVLGESVENSGGSPDAKEIESATWIHPVEIQDLDLKKALMLLLDEGESAAIVLALEQKASLIIVDDYDARVVAREYGLKVTGTIGLLLRAKYTGKISSLRNELDGLKESGFWLSEELYQRALKEAGEA